MSSDEILIVPTCHICNATTAYPVCCPGCDAVRYCSRAHLKIDRNQGHTPADCRRFKEHMQTQGLNTMPFPWHPQAPQPSRCTLLKELGLHQQGPWALECFCHSGTAYGIKAPLLKKLFHSTRNATITREELAPQLEEWFGVPEAKELLTTSISSKHGDFLPQNWEEYCEKRPLSLASPLPLLLDAPLTILWAIDRLKKKRKGVLPSRLVIYCVGAEKEVDQWPLLLELGALLPTTDLIVHVIGPEVPCWADNRSITVANPPPAGLNHSTKLHFHQLDVSEAIGERLSAPENHPDILVGLNAGLGAYPTWMSGLLAVRFMMQLSSKPEICLFTDYIAESVYLARRNLNMLFGPLQGCGFTDSCAGYDGERDISKRIKMSNTEINPFRKPRWVTHGGHMMPFAPNGFAVWLDVNPQ